jgi:hypothetical protein
MSERDAAIPAVLCIDVEPDARETDRHSRDDWRGFEAMCDALDELRPRLERATGAPARFSWFLRMDPQIELSYGSADWGLRRYADRFERLRAAGDEIGLHVHAWRWDEATGSWLIDFADTEWIEHCVRASAAAYESALGRRCRSFRFGDAFMSDAVAALLEELGIEFLLSVEPGRVVAPAAVGGERGTGSNPSHLGAPRVVFRPSRSNFRRRGLLRPRRLWVIPLTSGVVEPRFPPSRFVSPKARLLAVGARARGRPWGRLRADPDPIVVSSEGEPGATLIQWRIEGPSEIEVRVGAPDGPLFARSDRSGEASTGPWVRDGLLFFLEDVSARAAPRTLDVLRVVVAGENGHPERGALRRRAHRLSGRLGIGQPALDSRVVELGADQGAVITILDRALAQEGTTHLAMVARTDSASDPARRSDLDAALDHLIAHPRIARIAFTTPSEAVARARGRS